MNHTTHHPRKIRQLLPIQDVRLDGGFWKDRQELITGVTIPYIWEALNDRIPGVPKSAAVENFKAAAGLSDQGFFGLVSQDSDLAKWIEAASYSLMIKPDAELEALLDGVIEILDQAQEDDGYLNTHYSLNGIDKRWSFLRESCELYCAGHLIEAAVAHYEATGKDSFLRIARKYADHIGRVFGREEGQKRGYCGHAEVELALVRLYRVTGDEEYLRLSKYFVEERGQKPYYFTVEKAAASSDRNIMEHLVYALEEENYQHSQSHLPVREQEHADGHSVKGMYLYSSMADLALEYGDGELLQACKRLWDSVVGKRMHITGGIGSSAVGEMFTFDYDLPNDASYNETCASIGLIFWAQRMLRLEPDRKYADVMERALYNGVLSGLALSGKQFFYTNPLEIWPEACAVRKDKEHILTERQHWFDCPCCPPNISRLITSLGQYIYTLDEDVVYTHLYMSSSAKIGSGSGAFTLVQESGYPWNGSVRLRIEGEAPVKRTLALRIPGWARDYAIMLNGVDITKETAVENGYAKIDRVWTDGDTLELLLPMDVEKVYAHPKVRYNGGKVALQRGPVVYCLEEADNGPVLSGISLPRESKPEARFEEGLLNGVVALYADAVKTAVEQPALYSAQRPAEEKVRIKAVPYYAWNNRGRGEMAVWINER
ncbi:glycoside hydrolase family 127 protein [Cohnella caldifontis]|uniref:glycoside hydrolase family 127 protein n=1 Tax=Cohnella caldifontis TaxID=3027471 RepID=UPI0023EA888A|nr:beta-L-arabinofuranosidase domain-containing protein [Cohnella sp. YIM B05605]